MAVNEMDLPPSVIVDFGSGYVKAGLSTEFVPKVVERNVVGMRKSRTADSGLRGWGCKDSWVGSETERIEEHLTLTEPVLRGNVQNWDTFEKVMHYTFYNWLRVAPEEQVLILTGAALHKEPCERWAQIMFETFNVPALITKETAALSLYASGKLAGLVADLGHGSSHFVPVYEGHVIRQAIRKLDIGGKDVAEIFAKRMGDRGPGYERWSAKWATQSMVECVVRVALHFDQETAACASVRSTHNFRLPDGREINMTLSGEHVQAAEEFFQPLGHADSGIHRVTQQTIAACSPELQKRLWNNVVLAGGSSMLPGMRERLQLELQSLAPADAPARVLAPVERKHSAWLGGLILASFSVDLLEQMYVTREQYDEEGPRVSRRFL